MFLNIILTILVIVLITITVLLVIWWRKFGKNIFEIITKIKSVGKPVNPNFTNGFPNMKDLTDQIQNINQMMKGYKK